MASNSKTRSSSSASSTFKPGTLVEISSDDDGFRGSWFTGKIVRRLVGDKFMVEYDNLMADEDSKKRLKESIRLRQLRPIPPKEITRDFKFGEEVDAFHNDGWWEGHITGILEDGRKTVYFRVSREQLDFPNEELRLHREWVNGSWIPPFPEQDDSEIQKAVCVKAAETVTGEKADFKFEEGALVEVCSDEDGFKGAWFSATLIEPKAGWKFIVEYESLLDDDSKLLREEVSILQIRPRPPKTYDVNQFKFLDEVDTYYNDGWWVGIVSKVLGDSKYMVYFRNSNEELEFEYSQLRLHQEWVDNKWVMASKFEMARRNDAAIASALKAMAQAMQNQPNNDENAGSRSLATFQREKPPTFKGKNDPDGALEWLKEIERIFRVMDCTPAQKVRYGTHMLAAEADDWWLETRQRLEIAGEDITWAVFRREFLRKYYPEDVRAKKEIEFLELKQGNMSITEYAAKFVELAKFYPHYNEATAEFSKCIKFENGLHPEIKMAVRYRKIRNFSDLIDSCRIYEEDNNAHYKILSEKRGKHQLNRGKPYDAPAGKNKKKVAHGQRTSGGDAPASIECFKCGKPGHKSNVCTAEVKRCFCCGKAGHVISECRHK